MRSLLKLLLLFFLLITTIFANTSTQRAAIVFDASGSMWGRIDGKSKISIAKEALSSVIKNWNQDIPLELTIYGHRKKADCNDIETVVPLAPLNKEKILSIIKDIQPKGKTPIVRSLKKVVNELNYTKNRVTIILISDGKETCDENPLKAIKDLKSKGVNLVIHVIGFNVDKEASKQLNTIAKITNGSYHLAKDASSLTKAVKVVAKKVLKESKPKLPAKNLKITASETKGGKHIQALHKIYKDNSNSNLEVESCISYIKKPCSIKVPAGKYTINSSYNYLEKNSSIEVYDSNITKIDVVMDKTSLVSIVAKEKKGAKQIVLNYEIFTKDSNKMLLSSNTLAKKEVTHRLPIGEYILRYEYYTNKGSMDFTIKPNKKNFIEIIAGETGEAEITASEVKDGALVNAFYSFYTLDNNATVATCRSRKQKSCSVRLLANRYRFLTQYKNLEVSSLIDIKYNKKVKKHIVLKPTGKIKIVAREVENGSLISPFYMVYKDSKKLNLENKMSQKEDNNITVIELFSGNYTLEAKYFGYKKELPITIEPNVTKEIELIMVKTGYLEVSAKVKKSGKPVKARYTLYKESNKTLELAGFSCEYKTEFNCSYHIPIGSYKLKAEYEPFTQIKKVTISHNKKSNLLFVMNPSGELKVDAYEENSNKKVDTMHYIYHIVNGVVDKNSDYKICRSDSNVGCELELPVGKYKLHSTYNHFNKESFFEIKEDKTTSLHVIMGGTGDVNITAYEREDSKPLELVTHSIEKKENNKTLNVTDCYHDIYCIKRLPVGEYIVNSDYNLYKKTTTFKIEQGKVTNLKIIMGQTGILEVVASKTKNGKGIIVSNSIYKVIKGKKPKSLSVMCWYKEKLQGCRLTLPVGEYILETKYKDIKKITPFEIKYNQISKVRVVLSP